MGGDDAKIGRATPVGPGMTEDLQNERKPDKNGSATPVGSERRCFRAALQASVVVSNGFRSKRASWRQQLHEQVDSSARKDEEEGGGLLCYKQREEKRQESRKPRARVVEALSQLLCGRQLEQQVLEVNKDKGRDSAARLFFTREARSGHSEALLLPGGRY
jgi:hypothetical protein